MRKQTKFVAVASAAAILAIGASMTSFAATGWVEEDGVWYFYNKDGSKVEDEWKKSGDSWYWLSNEENGGMAVDKLIEDSDNKYYVDSNGQMVKNTWVKVVNEDQDDDDAAEYNYYYMQSNGKAYKAGDNSNTKFRTIDGKRYAFNDEGKMLYGWVDGDGSRRSGEDDWAAAGDVYYCGEWNDGAMKTGWQLIHVHDNEEEDNLDRWFWFKSNGKRFANTTESKENIKEKKINGNKYGFDSRGVMVSQWTLTSGSNSSSASDWKYFSSPEEGARKTKGWFKVVAPNKDNTFSNNTYDGSFAKTHAEDESEKWYYADGDGNLAAGEIKKIKGKYYGFRPNDDGGLKGAAMLSGLVLIKVEDGKIVEVGDDDVDSDKLDDILKETSKKHVDKDFGLYYFGSNADTDGSMKTGATTVNLDGSTYNFNFAKSGGVESRGKGVNGIDGDKYIYKFGCKIKADNDDKYQIVQVTGTKGDTSIGSDSAFVEKIKSQDMRQKADSTVGRNSDGEKIHYTRAFDDSYYLVNTSGTIIKSKTAAKDGNEWYFYVDGKEIKQYTSSKNLKGTILVDWKTDKKDKSGK